MQDKAQIIYVAQFILLMIYFKSNTGKDVLHKSGFKCDLLNWNFQKLISSKVFCPNIGTVDNRVLSLGIQM